MAGGDGADDKPLPLRAPCLAWSFNHDGELDPRLLDQRDRHLVARTGARRARRANLARLSRPQHGVNAIAAAFPGARDAPAGVAEADDF